MPWPRTRRPCIQRYRTLGRTGFEVGDISMGCGSIAESNVVRYAYDHGINLFDTAEGYGNGDSETKIGEAMQHMERDKIFIVTKLGIDDDPDQQNLVERFNKSLERLQTAYADALYCPRHRRPEAGGVRALPEGLRPAQAGGQAEARRHQQPRSARGRARRHGHRADQGGRGRATTT